MKVEVKELKISNELAKKIDMICRFIGVSSAFSSGCVKNIKETCSVTIDVTPII